MYRQKFLVYKNKYSNIKQGGYITKTDSKLQQILDLESKYHNISRKVEEKEKEKEMKLETFPMYKVYVDQLRRIESELTCLQEQEAEIMNNIENIKKNEKISKIEDEIVLMYNELCKIKDNILKAKSKSLEIGDSVTYNYKTYKVINIDNDWNGITIEDLNYPFEQIYTTPEKVEFVRPENKRDHSQMEMGFVSSYKRRK